MDYSRNFFNLLNVLGLKKKERRDVYDSSLTVVLRGLLDFYGNQYQLFSKIRRRRGPNLLAQCMIEIELSRLLMCVAKQ